ncbi:DivIVA domain-containing protein [Micromonospora viridifaciens]|uniref:Cell wall synthesis protein Wag31 n=1 Tax=Micromonospora viridifaciens TaxID=1881 RepID=A0A1C4VH94_MICVI|nr:DivIVA domain-containing protein [Micromonospora viridifaciens]SCE83211.1 DivIVA domain-containing protein [Micromonospora viridifaciens]
MIYGTRKRLLPHHVRAAVFDRHWRGLDPTQVRDHLDQVADELERLHRELTTANTEAERIRQALRQWQSRHKHCRHRDPDARRPR